MTETNKLSLKAARGTVVKLSRFAARDEAEAKAKGRAAQGTQDNATPKRDLSEYKSSTVPFSARKGSAFNQGRSERGERGFRGERDERGYRGSAVSGAHVGISLSAVASLNMALSSSVGASLSAVSVRDALMELTRHAVRAMALIAPLSMSPRPLRLQCR